MQTRGMGLKRRNEHWIMWLVMVAGMVLGLLAFVS
jgi:hypothetical protein